MLPLNCDAIQPLRHSVDLRGLPAGLDDGMEFFRAALERKVIVVPGEFFDVNPGQRRRHLGGGCACLARGDDGREPRGIGGEGG